MTGRDFDTIVKSAIGAALVGLTVWVFNINADVRVNTQRIIHVEDDQKEVIAVVKDLTDAVNDLRVVIESLKKD